MLAVIPDKDIKAVIRADAMNRPPPGLRTDARVAMQTLQREMSVPDSSGRVQLWDGETGSHLRSFSEHTAEVLCSPPGWCRTNVRGNGCCGEGGEGGDDGA